MANFQTHYKHLQESAATVWTVQHNLMSYPITDVYVSKDDFVQKIMPQNVTYVDKNTCTIEFSEALTGFALVA